VILLLDTSTDVCKLTIVAADRKLYSEWLAERLLAKNLLSYLKEQLASHSKTWDDITGLGVFTGPGSFTGLRIGTTVFNTIANSQHVPIVGSNGKAWQQKALKKLAEGHNNQIVLPFYDKAANITKPRR
jgi:tRNA threonylcarbamoyladenosine biosynthesis protein TsaB